MSASCRPASLLLAPLMAALLAVGCAENPVTGRSELVLMSEDQEIALGRQTHPQIVERFGRYGDPALQAYVQRVGDQLAARSHRPELVYRFTVLDTDDVNAFALPGGYIYVTRGMLAYLDSEAQLAAVLGHEVGHVTARHSVQQYTAAQAAQVGYLVGSILLPDLRTASAQNLFNLLGTALLRGYGREHELEADRLGAQYMARTGYDANAMLAVLGSLKDQESFETARARREGRESRVYHGVFATHPDHDTRLQQVVGQARAFAAAGPGRVNREGFLHRIDGLTYGPGAKEGVFRGRRFYHAELGIGLRFPHGWRIENRPDRLLAHAPQNAALLQVMTAELNRRISPRVFMHTRLGLETVYRGRPLDADLLAGYTGFAWTRTPYGRRLTRITVMYHANRAYIFAGAGRREGSVRTFDAPFLDTALSLHPLSEGERALAAPRRLGLVRAGPDTRYADLAERSQLASHPLAELRLLNGDYPDGEPVPGQLLKIVR